jgi:hypothetical protein
MELTFVEQPVFTKAIVRLTDDDSYRLFQNEIAQGPERWPSSVEAAACGRRGCALPAGGKVGAPECSIFIFAATAP